MNRLVSIDVDTPLVSQETRDTESAISKQGVIVYLLSVIRRRKWVIIGCIISALALGLVVSLLMTPRYKAFTTISIQRESRNFTLVQGADSRESSAADLEFYQTQYGLLQARSLALRVANALKLQDNKAFLVSGGVSDAKEWFDADRPKASAPSRADRSELASKILLKNIAITPQRLSSLINITYTNPDPALAQRIANAWGQEFIAATQERRVDATSYARRFLEGRLTSLRDKIDESERTLVGYASRENIINLPATAGENGGDGTGERSLVIDNLAALNRELSVATSDRITAESRLGGAAGSASESLQNVAISGLRQRRAELAADYAKLMAQFEPSYPPAQALQDQIGQIDRSISREESRIGQSLQQTYGSALERENALTRRVKQLTGGVLDLRRRSIQYNIYLRDANTNRQLYDALLQRYKEIGVAGGIGVNNISVVDNAELPKKPSSPWLLLNLLLALIAGTALGGIAAITLEQFDQGIVDPEDVARLLQLPLLGTIPRVDSGDALAELTDRKAALTEAYVSVQTTLGFATDHGIPRTLAVTSTGPAEGKSTTSYALALSIARSGRRVVLVDGDMRSPSVHHLLAIDNLKGLSNYLSGDDSLAEIVRPSGLLDMDTITAGPQPPSAPELLSSIRFLTLIESLLEKYDHVIIDAPPVMGLADSPLLGSLVEGVLFVIEARRTQRETAIVAVNRLRSAHNHLLGAVLTKFEARHARNGYGYGYGYGYGDDHRRSA